MQYLAQVHKNDFLTQYELRLLASKEGEYLWSTISEPTSILLEKGIVMDDKMLVLVELSDAGDIESIEEATNWVMNLVQTFLSTGITPEFLKQEAENAEQWRQNLTLQNQDLARRALELEARREQIQELEESLKGEKSNDNS
ncbi:MAG: hypothetical protein EAZ76_12725 [Nostocales cyanobacterium]|nr:MAG: hypothetical protein EAZ87_15825 [Nostocales cyanobacterium]TAF12984.1 MAG: hypothetical protein EAZ76_12725 [Nostocales cyanobacterium]